MNREEALRAIEELSASPASRWIGNRIVDGVLLQKCMRCGAEETIELPAGVRGPADVPVGFDDRLFGWKRAFQVAHEGCAEGSSATVENAETAGAAPAERAPEAPVAGVTMKRFLQCAKHGLRRWQGHVLCDACGRTYQPGRAPETCRCGHRLLPPEAERVGDVLGLRGGGVVVDEEGRRYQTPEASDWTARPICYLCHRNLAKHHGGRLPVERGRS